MGEVLARTCPFQNNAVYISGHRVLRWSKALKTAVSQEIDEVPGVSPQGRGHDALR